MYRVYDRKEKYWINDVYLFPNDELFVYKKKMFGFERLTMLRDRNRYIIHHDTQLNDWNDVPIFEGDICEINKLGVFGVVAYSSEIGGYCVFDELRFDYYPITEHTSDKFDVIGNVFDDENILERQGKGGA